MSDEASEARAEAEAFSWAEYRREVAPNPRHAGREAVAFKAGFDAGAGWQAERDAERIRELEAEVAAALGSNRPRSGSAVPSDFE